MSSAGPMEGRGSALDVDGSILEALNEDFSYAIGSSSVPQRDLRRLPFPTQRIMRRFENAIAVGANNHVGAQFTRDRPFRRVAQRDTGHSQDRCLLLYPS